MPASIHPLADEPAAPRCFSPPPRSGIYTAPGVEALRVAVVEGCVGLTNLGLVVPLRHVRDERIDEDALPTVTLDASGLTVRLRAGALSLWRFRLARAVRTDGPLGALTLAAPLDTADVSRVGALLAHPEPAAEVAAATHLTRRADDPAACASITRYVADHEHDRARVAVVWSILTEAPTTCALPTLWRLLDDDEWGGFAMGQMSRRLSPRDYALAGLERSNRLRRRAPRGLTRDP